MTGKKFYIALALLVLRAFAQAGEQDSPNAAGKTRIDIAVAGEGTVSPSAGGTYEPGWKLSLRATPRTGSAFVGWYAIAADGLSTNALPGAYRNASYAYTVTAEPLTILARFVAKADDARFTVSCAPAADGYAAGEALSIPLAFDSITEVKSVTLKNAPAGVKYDAAKMALTGTPTKPGVYAVQFTARNAAAGTGTGQATVKVRNFVDAEVYPDLLDAYGPYMPGVVVTNDLAGVVAADSQVTGLPSGLSWNKSRCAIIGAATKPGTYTVMFTRTVDRVKHTASATFEVSALPVLKLERLGEGAGTVSGGGAFAANKKVTVRATAAAGSVFAGWYEDADATVPLRGSVDYRTASYALTMPAADETTLYARFIPKTADTNIAVACVWPDAGVDAGAAVDTPVLVTSETVPKVTVTGLPAGLKFDSKTLSFTGAATKPGVYTVTIKAVNASGYATTTTLVVKVNNFVSPDIPVEDAYPTEMVGVAVEIASEAFAGCAVSGLPTGLKFANGVISGVPSKAGSYTAIFTKGKSKASSTFTVLPLPASVVATFAGTAVGETDCGSATLTVAAGGRISGKVLLAGASWAFSATSFDSSSTFGADGTNLQVVATAKAGTATQPVVLRVSGEAAAGEMGEESPVALDLRPTAGKDAARLAQALTYAGVYTVSLGCDEAGYGYLSLTVDKSANVKATGKLPDGTAVSLTAPLLVDGESASAVLYLAPSGYKGGCVFGVLRFSRGDGADAPGEIDGDDFTWVSKASDASMEYGAGFDRTLSVTGAWYNRLGALSDYYGTLAFNAELPTYWATIREIEDGKATTSLEEAEAADLACLAELTVSVSGSRFVVDQGAATTPVQVDGEWTYEGANDAALAFAFTQATGIFKGSFTAYYDYASQVNWDTDREVQSHVARKYSFEGIAVQAEAALMRGFFLSTAVGVYEDDAGAEKTFTYVQSNPVSFE